MLIDPFVQVIRSIEATILSIVAVISAVILLISKFKELISGLKSSIASIISMFSSKGGTTMVLKHKTLQAVFFYYSPFPLPY